MNKELFNNLKTIQDQLFDAEPEVKTAFNDIVNYFDNNADHYMLWRSISIKNKKTGISITTSSNDDLGVLTVKGGITDDQKKLLSDLNIKVNSVDVRTGPDPVKDRFKGSVVSGMNSSKWNSDLVSTANALAKKGYEIHAVPDFTLLKDLDNNKIKYNKSKLIQFDTHK